MAVKCTPRLRAVLEQAARLGQQGSIAFVGVEHVLLAILREGQSVATTVLAEHVDLDTVERELVTLMSSTQTGELVVQINEKEHLVVAASSGWHEPLSPLLVDGNYQEFERDPDGGIIRDEEGVPRRRTIENN